MIHVDDEVQLITPTVLVLVLVLVYIHYNCIFILHPSKIELCFMYYFYYSNTKLDSYLSVSALQESFITVTQ